MAFTETAISGVACWKKSTKLPKGEEISIWPSLHPLSMWTYSVKAQRVASAVCGNRIPDAPQPTLLRWCVSSEPPTSICSFQFNSHSPPFPGLVAMLQEDDRIHHVTISKTWEWATETNKYWGSTRCVTLVSGNSRAWKTGPLPQRLSVLQQWPLKCKWIPPNWASRASHRVLAVRKPPASTGD